MGRDNNQQGQGRSGQGQGRRRYQAKTTWSYGNKGPEMKFYPHGGGTKGQSVTYATVKDNIVSFIQSSYRYGKDIAVSFRDLQKKDLSAERPTRMISNKTGDDKKLEQDGFDMIYQAEIKQFLERERALEDNLDKAYAHIFGTYCSKAIQSRVEEHPNYETTIRDNPIELLETVSVLMHDTVRAKYPYVSLYDAMMHLFNMRQQEQEHLNDYVKRFKQSHEVLKSHMGLKWLVMNTEEYQNETQAEEQSKLKKQAFERFMAFVLLRNSDQAKYQSLMNGLISQYSMENDQYPKTITTATDILANHRHDNSITKHRQTKQKESKMKMMIKVRQQMKPVFYNLVGLCAIAVERKDKSPQCPEKDTRPKDQWAIRKAEQHLQAETNDDDESVGSNITNGTNRSSQRAGWSGVQVNLMNHNQQPPMRETITLDNGSTLSLFCNPELVESIRESKMILKMCVPMLDQR